MQALFAHRTGHRPARILLDLCLGRLGHFDQLVERGFLDLEVILEPRQLGLARRRQVLLAHHVGFLLAVYLDRNSLFIRLSRLNRILGNHIWQLRLRDFLDSKLATTELCRLINDYNYKLKN